MQYIYIYMQYKYIYCIYIYIYMSVCAPHPPPRPNLAELSKGSFQKMQKNTFSSKVEAKH